MSGNYPYIPDKRMYAAVMSAIKYIRKTGEVSKAVKYNAAKYNVDAEEMLEHIRVRQNTSIHKKKRDYKYYVSVIVYDFHYLLFDISSFKSAKWDEDDYKANTRTVVVKSVAEKNVINRLTQDNPRSWETGDYIRVQHIWEFDTQDMAEQFKEALTWEDIRNYILPKTLRLEN